MNNLKQSLLIFSITLSFFFFSFSGAAQGKQWVNIGPAPIQSSGGHDFFGQGPVTGRVADVAVDPRDSNHWLIGAAFGGVWETKDAGITWVPRTDDQETLAMGAIAFTPSDPKTVYAGTGEAVWFVGAGLLKSMDGGMTWEMLTDKFAGTSFSDIKVNPIDPNNLIVATTWANSLCSMCGRPSSGPESGIYTSDDGGNCWSLRLKGSATDLEVDPNDFNRQYSGLGNMFGHADNGVYRSTKGGSEWTLIDGQSTWGQKIGGVGRVELALAPSNPDIVYVIIQDAKDNNGNDNGILGLWWTKNAWADKPTWEEIPLPNNNSPFSFGEQTYYDLEIIVDPENADVLYAGGVWLCRWTRGASPAWMGIQGGIHVDHHTMAWAGNKLIVGNDGGIYSTTDGGDTWANHNTNLSITQFYYGSVHPTDPNFAIGGSQDNGSEIRTNTDAWKRIYSGDGADNAISSNNPDRHWAISSQNLNIVKTIDGGKTYSSPMKDTSMYTVLVDSQGDNLTISNTFPEDYFWDESLEVGDPAYVDTDHVYRVIRSEETFLGLHVLRTANANADKTIIGNRFTTFEVNQPVTVYVAHDSNIQSKPQWLDAWTKTSIFFNIGFADGADTRFMFLYEKNFPKGRVVLGGNGGFSGIDRRNAPFIARFAKCPANDDIFIAGTNKIWRTENFFSSTHPSWLPNSDEMYYWQQSQIDTDSWTLTPGSIAALTFAPSDPNCLTYVFGEPHTGQIHRTTNGGNSWVQIDPETIPCCIEELAFHPDDPNILYVAAAPFPNGVVLKTTNALDPQPTWFDVTPPEATTGPSSLLVDPLHPSNVYVGTFTGVWHSSNGGETWTYMGPETGMPHVPVYDLEANTLGDIFAFTYGRGAFKLVATGDIKYLIGDKDDFHPGDQVDTPPQSQLVRDLIDSRAPEDKDVDLDVGGVNRPVGLTHYFAIPQNAEIISAHIEFRFKGSEHVHNDGILYKEPNFPVILLKDLLGFEPRDCETYTVNMDLSTVPVRTGGDPGPGGHFTDGPVEYRNLLTELSDGQFDMVFVDDTTLDYSELTIEYTIPPVIGRDQIDFDPITSTYDPTFKTCGCTPENDFVGKFSFEATLKNKGNTPLSGLMVEVTDLENIENGKRENRLILPDGNMGGVGAMFPIPRKDGYLDGVLRTGESVTVHFDLCLGSWDPFLFYVNVLGIVE